MEITKPALFSATHRAQGNSNKAMDLFAHGIQEAGGDAELFYLRNFKIKPCTACRLCEMGRKPRHLPTKCPLSNKDFAHELFQQLLYAPFVFFASPIYFYHLPSIFKTWIDRGQEYWAYKKNGDEIMQGIKPRPAYVCLMAGRDKGDRLFEGALLTLKYFLDSFELTITDPLTLRGVERLGDLEKSEGAQQLVELGKSAWKQSQDG